MNRNPPMNKVAKIDFFEMCIRAAQFVITLVTLFLYQIIVYLCFKELSLMQVVIACALILSMSGSLLIQYMNFLKPSNLIYLSLIPICASIYVMDNLLNLPTY